MMTAKEYLSQVSRCDTRIKALIRTRDLLRSKALCNSSPRMDADKVSSSGGSSGGGAVSSGGWLRPLASYRVTSPFGNREQPTEGASTNHQGIDLAAPEGNP